MMPNQQTIQFATEFDRFRRWILVQLESLPEEQWVGFIFTHLISAVSGTSAC
jgi:hypothetical protein